MQCPDCHFQESAVLDTRLCCDGAMIKRRRKCLECGARFGTLEKLDNTELMVKKRNNTKQPFDIDKIRKGVVLACEKRSIETREIDDLVKEVEDLILSKGLRVVESKEIGDMVMNILRNIDKVAYLRYVSVCRSFDNVESFEEELKNLKQ